MEELNLGYLEKALAYSSVFGEDKELFCPAILEYISDRTFLDENNLFVLTIVKHFYLKNQKVPSLSEIKTYLNTDEKNDKFKLFVKGYKTYKLEEFDTFALLKSAEEFFKQRLFNRLMEDALAQNIADEHIDFDTLRTEMDEVSSIYMLDDIGLSLFEKEGYEAYIAELLNSDNRISTGFDNLDLQLGGGLLTGGSALYNIAAPSNVGKSNFIKSIACNVSKQGKNCAVFSLEMPRYIYADRFVSEMTQIDIFNLKNETEEVGKFLKGAKDSGYGGILIKDFATGSITPQGLSSFIKRAERHLGIKFDCIFVDYPELLKPSKTYTRHDLMVASLYVETRALSFYHECPFVVVSQLNRDGYKTEAPTMENIGSAIGIAQCSDFMLMLWATEEMKALNEIGSVVGKSRFGPVGRLQRYDCCPRTLKLTESTRTNVDNHMSLDDTETEEDVTAANDFFNEMFNLEDDD